MVLIIDDRTYAEKCRLADLRPHANLLERSTKFARSTEIQQPENEFSRTIYVAQREFAVLSRTDPHGFHLLGSDDATTCHIFVLDNHAAVALAHLDGCETRASIEAMLNELKKFDENETNFDVYLAGGFIEENVERNHSLELSNEILEILCRRPNETFHVRLAAITEHNDELRDRRHFPLIYGLCFDVREKTLRKMNFRNFGPAFRLRSVFHSVSSHPCHCLYSSLRGEISLPKFRIDRNIVDRFYRPLFAHYFSNDRELLRLTSTSPEQERPTYLENMKKTIVFIVKFSSKLPDWFDSTTNSIVFRWLDERWRTDSSQLVDEFD